MMKINYIDKNEISICGSSTSLKKFADQIRDLTSEVSFSASGDASINKIIVCPSSDKILIRVDENKLIISGNSNSLKNLSDNIPWDAEDPESEMDYHVHYDKIMSGEFLDPKSPDLVITKNRL